MNFPNFIQLFDAKEALEGAKESILDEWVSQKQCAPILGKHGIDPQWFKAHYAAQVFDYFMGVVAGDVELGQCPVMKEFIEYLKNQEIRSDELFLLCTYFKRSMINATYRLDINSHGLFESISYLFDMNFAGVLTLYTDTIYQKEQEAIEANIAKEYFLSNMSHEIRTPLNAILGFVHLLKSENLGERIEKYLDIIDQSGENLLHIINDILDFSKLRSGEFAIDPHPFNLYDEIASTLELFTPSATMKSISISNRISPNVPRCIMADSFRIRQILANLLSNAIKFSPPNRPIDVDIDVNRSNSTLSIRVRDYGKGIAIEDQERIFNPFYQASEGIKFGEGGSGLGLSICKQLATQMGGEITLESNIGWGSLFLVTLKIEFPSQELCDVKRVMNTASLFKGKVLVAEDNAANQELIRITLQRYGTEVTIVSNGEEALKCVMAQPYDLVLMDEQMPIMMGHEAVAKIRHFEQSNNRDPSPIVALSANVLKGSREQAIEWGYDAFLGKPFDLDEIGGLLERYLVEDKHLAKSKSMEVQSSTELERLMQTLMLEPQQIVILLELFHANMETMLEELKEAIEVNDFELISKVSHTVKGSSANFRFGEFSTFAALLESSATKRSMEFDFKEAYKTLEEEYRRLPHPKELYSSR